MDSRGLLLIATFGLICACGQQSGGSENPDNPGVPVAPVDPCVDGVCSGSVCEADEILDTSVSACVACPQGTVPDAQQSTCVEQDSTLCGQTVCALGTVCIDVNGSLQCADASACAAINSYYNPSTQTCDPCGTDQSASPDGMQCLDKSSACDQITCATGYECQSFRLNPADPQGQVEATCVLMDGRDIGLIEPLPVGAGQIFAIDSQEAHYLRVQLEVGQTDSRLSCSAQWYEPTGVAKLAIQSTSTALLDLKVAVPDAGGFRAVAWEIKDTGFADAGVVETGTDGNLFAIFGFSSDSTASTSTLTKFDCTLYQP